MYDDPVGWIRRVAINKVRDGHRSRVRRDRTVERLGHEVRLTSEQPDISEVAELLSTLPKQQRAAAAMFYVEQLSVLEIAEALDIELIKEVLFTASIEVSGTYSYNILDSDYELDLDSEVYDALYADSNNGNIEINDTEVCNVREC